MWAPVLSRGPEIHRSEGSLVSERAFLGVIYRDDIKSVCRPSNRNVNWRSPVQGKSPPVQVNLNGYLQCTPA